MVLSDIDAFELSVIVQVAFKCTKSATANAVEKEAGAQRHPTKPSKEPHPAKASSTSISSRSTESSISSWLADSGNERVFGRSESKVAKRIASSKEALEVWGISRATFSIATGLSNRTDRAKLGGLRNGIRDSNVEKSSTGAGSDVAKALLGKSAGSSIVMIETELDAAVVSTGA